MLRRINTPKQSRRRISTFANATADKYAKAIATADKTPTIWLALMNWTIFNQQVFPIRHKLYRFALRITGNIHEAEDIVQEVLEKVWKTDEAQANHVQNWEAWCMTLTRNRSLDKNRARTIRRTQALENTPERLTPDANPAQALESQDAIAHIRQFMQELPEKQRLVMHLRDIEEHSYEEIAEVLNISMEQVKVNLHRARKAIREKLIGIETITT
jgi:RNA polymerase sigma-70 factor (ECF subfamily)